MKLEDSVAETNNQQDHVTRLSIPINNLYK